MRNIFNSSTLKMIYNENLYMGIFRYLENPNRPVRLSPCQVLLKAYQKRRRMGASMPSCSPNGEWSPKQCNASSRYCWCVNPKTGKRIAGTSKRWGGLDCSK